MVKKCLSLLLALIIVISVPTASFAEGINENDSDMLYHSVIADADELEEIITNENIVVPDGYNLEKVEKTGYITVGENELLREDVSTIKPGYEVNGVIYELRNKNVEPPFIYVNNYYLDVFQGYANITEKYQYSKEVIKNINVTIGSNTVKSCVGYSKTQKYDIEKTFSTTAPAGKILHLHIDIIYRRTSFDIYKKSTGALVQSYAYTDRPIGLQFTQYIYG